MGRRLYAVAVKTTQGLKFEPHESTDLEAIEAATQELAKDRAKWERENVIPIEDRVKGDCDRSYVYGVTTWASMFSDRQMLATAVSVEELRKLRSQMASEEGLDRAGAVEHLLAFAVDKFLNYNSVLASWHAPRSVIRSVFDRHDVAFILNFATMTASA